MPYGEVSGALPRYSSWAMPHASPFPIPTPHSLAHEPCQTFGSGDTVGCGISLIREKISVKGAPDEYSSRVNGAIFFTKNGRVMGRPARSQDGEGGEGAGAGGIQGDEGGDEDLQPIERLTGMVFAFMVQDAFIRHPFAPVVGLVS